MVPEMPYGKAVSLLEILRCYAEAYVQATHSLVLLQTAISRAQDEGKDIRNDSALLARLSAHLFQLVEHCDRLPMTQKGVHSLIRILENPKYMESWSRTEHVLMTSITEVLGRLEDELSLNLFFRLPADKKKYFDEPLKGWEEVIKRFPEITSNVEEMSKCFALSRYASSVFHALRAIEGGLIHLGVFLKVPDPKSGWTAVISKLAILVVKTNYKSLPRNFKKCFPFLEQMHGVTEALKSAWRNKISHAQGSLTLMTEDFSPDIAEEIMIASRSFMRRLATEMP
jgi:hypothetical protein